MKDSDTTSMTIRKSFLVEIKKLAAKYGLSQADALRRVIFFGLPLAHAEQISILKSNIGDMDSLDDVMEEKRRVTQKIRGYADQALHDVV